MQLVIVACIQRCQKLCSTNGSRCCHRMQGAWTSKLAAACFRKTPLRHPLSFIRTAAMRMLSKADHFTLMDHGNHRRSPWLPSPWPAVLRKPLTTLVYSQSIRAMQIRSIFVMTMPGRLRDTIGSFCFVSVISSSSQSSSSSESKAESSSSHVMPSSPHLSTKVFIFSPLPITVLSDFVSCE
jgi:hypothetical protein